MHNGICISIYVKPIYHPYAFYVAPLTRIFTHVKNFSQLKMRSKIVFQFLLVPNNSEYILTTTNAKFV